MIPSQSPPALAIPEILRHLESLEPGIFPREALESASARRDEITPHLLAILEDAIRRVRQHEDCPDWMAPTHAMYLLAEFREPRAVPLVIRLISSPRDDVEGVLGEEFTDGLGDLLAALCEMNTHPLLELAADKDADGYVRWNALEALVILVAHDRVVRPVVINLIERLFHEELKRTENAVWTGIASTCHEIHPGEFMDDLRQIYEEGLVESFIIPFEALEADAKKSVETVMARLRKRKQPLMQNAILAMENWHCFKEKEEPLEEEPPETSDKPSDPPPIIPAQGSPRSYEPPTPYHRPAPKVGRNDPCPCGSGKKHKRCCQKA